MVPGITRGAPHGEDGEAVCGVCDKFDKKRRELCGQHAARDVVDYCVCGDSGVNMHVCVPTAPFVGVLLTGANLASTEGLVYVLLALIVR